MLKGWELQLDKCPCDAEFIEWMMLKLRNNTSKEYNIFHMGTGLHHLVGNKLYPYCNVLGMTYSEEEHKAYIEMAKLRGVLPSMYHVLFGDIHHLNFRLLPRFDIVTLFHLGEQYEPGTGTISPDVVLLDFIDILNPDGHILAYANSAAKDISIPLFDNAMELVEEYKHLRIYKKK